MEVTLPSLPFVQLSLCQVTLPENRPHCSQHMLASGPACLPKTMSKGYKFFLLAWLPKDASHSMQHNSDCAVQQHQEILQQAITLPLTGSDTAQFASPAPTGQPRTSLQMRSRRAPKP